MAIDMRMVLEYDQGQWTFRNFRHNASYEQLLLLALGLNSFQSDAVKRTLLVTSREF